MNPVEINNQLRSKAFGLASVVSGMLAIGALFSAEWLMTTVASAFCLLLFINSKVNKVSKEQSGAHWLSHIVVGFLALITLASLVHYPQTAEQWCYLLPLVAFFIYRVQTATFITASYSIALAFALIGFYEGPEKVQIFFIYLLALAMTLAFVYLREIKENQLKPLRRTDNLTLASMRDYLLQDLDKEVQRAEREGTDLAVLALGIDDESLSLVSQDKFDMFLHQLGRLLHENLRLFDSYYRFEDADFVIVLPHTDSKEATKKAAQLRLRSRQKLSSKDTTVTISIGIATLNVGDSAETLIGNARKALKVARGKGVNQTLGYLDISNEDTGIAG